MKDDSQKLKKLEAQVSLLLSRVNDLDSRLAALEKRSPKPARFALPRTVLKSGEFALPADDSAKPTRPSRRREPPKF